MAIIIKLEKSSRTQIELIENLHRNDLTPFKEAAALDSLVKEHNLTLQGLATMMGNPRSYISQMLCVNLIPADGPVPIGQERLRVPASPGNRVIHCQHPDGSISILAHETKAGERPAPLLQIQAS